MTDCKDLGFTTSGIESNLVTQRESGKFILIESEPADTNRQATAHYELKLQEIQANSHR